MSIQIYFVSRTFMSNMFFGPPGPDCKPHMYRMRQVFPQPVSPMTITGIPHLTKYKSLQLSDLKIRLKIAQQNRHLSG